MMEIDTPFKEGYLLFPPHGVLGQLKKSWHKRYCQLFKPSKHGIERLEVFDNELEVGKNSNEHSKIITLENCIKITPDAQRHHQNVFTILTRTNIYHFATSTEKEMTEWITAFQSIAFKDGCSKQTIEEDNDLYCSSADGVFSVRLVPSEASTRCGLEPGNYTLVIASAAIQLRDCQEHHVLFMWPYRYIRRYGYRDGKFTFEAGRKCDTGEGTFHLEHSNEQEIFRCISSKMKSMRKLLSGESSSTPGIVCGDNQFHAALSMEAGSRSPLPPSPTSATTPLIDVDFNAMSQSSTKPLISPIVETKSLLINNISSTKPVPKPRKPPRKAILCTANVDKLGELSADSIGFGRYKQTSSSDILASTLSIMSSSTASTLCSMATPSVSATPENIVPYPNNSAISNVTNSAPYDKVVVRKDAWRTLGVDDINHTENVIMNSDGEEEQPATVLPVSQQQDSNDVSKKSQCSKILPTQLASKPESLGNYDTLQHFGSSSKINANPGYRHIPTNSGSSTLSPGIDVSISKEQYPAWNEYDMITENIQSCRLADDSHYGYGMIRKKSGPIENEGGPKHKVYNELEYAVIQKPKKV
ncbi:docking protein 3 [Anabrus simplex]|uniref:docking protein 3 n=1 Tax=Anabrus simplex TaxID=316456 RepID=UPI0035A38702